MTIWPLEKLRTESLSQALCRLKIIPLWLLFRRLALSVLSFLKALLCRQKGPHLWHGAPFLGSDAVSVRAKKTGNFQKQTRWTRNVQILERQTHPFYQIPSLGKLHNTRRKSAPFSLGKAWAFRHSLTINSTCSVRSTTGKSPLCWVNCSNAYVPALGQRYVSLPLDCLAQ